MTRRNRSLGPVRRAMRPRGPQPRLGRLIIAAQAVAAVAVLTYLYIGDGGEVPFSDRYEARIEFADGAGLKTGNHPPVTVAGVPAGRVESVEVDDGRAVAVVALDPDLGERIGSDASATIVPRSALQDLTIDVDPGHVDGGALADGGTIHASRTTSIVAADRVVGVLDADTRAYAQVLLTELQAGLDGRGPDLGVDLDRLGQLTDTALPVARALDERRRLLVRMVDEMDRVYTALDSRGAQLADVVVSGRATLETTAAREEELAATVTALPQTMADLRGALAGVRELSEPLQPALEELRPFAQELPGTLAAVREFVPDGRALVGDLGELVDRGSKPVSDLRAALGRLGPAAEGARGPIQKLEPIVNAIDANKDGIGVLGDNFSGVFSTNDQNGPILRGLGFFEDPKPENLGFPATAAGQAEANLAAAKALKQVCLRENPLACLVRYTVPGLAGSVASVTEGVTP